MDGEPVIPIVLRSAHPIRILSIFCKTASSRRESLHVPGTQHSYLARSDETCLAGVGTAVPYLLVGLSDRYLAGHFHPPDESLQVSYQAAQTTANYLAWFIVSYTVLVSVGSTALVARFVGAGNRSLATRTTHQSILLAIVFGLAARWPDFGDGRAAASAATAWSVGHVCRPVSLADVFLADL